MKLCGGFVLAAALLALPAGSQRSPIQLEVLEAEWWPPGARTAEGDGGGPALRVGGMLLSAGLDHELFISCLNTSTGQPSSDRPVPLRDATGSELDDVASVRCQGHVYDSSPTMPSALDWFVPPTRFGINPVTELLAPLTTGRRRSSSFVGVLPMYYDSVLPGGSGGDACSRKRLNSSFDAEPFLSAAEVAAAAPPCALTFSTQASLSGPRCVLTDAKGRTLDQTHRWMTAQPGREPGGGGSAATAVSFPFLPQTSPAAVNPRVMVHVNLGERRKTAAEAAAAAGDQNHTTQSLKQLRWQEGEDDHDASHQHLATSQPHGPAALPRRYAQLSHHTGGHPSATTPSASNLHPAAAPPSAPVAFLEDSSKVVHGMKIFNLLFKPIIGKVAAPAVDIVGTVMEGGMMNKIFTDLNHKLVGVVPPQVAQNLKIPVAANVTNLMPDSLVRALCDELTAKLLAKVGDFLIDSISKPLRPKLQTPLQEILGKSIPDTLDQALPKMIERSLSILLTNALTRSVTHALVPTLIHSLAQKHGQAAICYECFYFNRKCHECSTSRESVYYVIYHADYYSDYFSDYYAMYYCSYLDKLVLEMLKRERGKSDDEVQR